MSAPIKGRPRVTLADLHPHARRCLERALASVKVRERATADVAKNARRAVELGAPLSLVARELGVDRATVRRWVRHGE